MKEILCTLGPSSLNEWCIKRMEEIGVSLFRLNLSHIEFEDLEKHINLIRTHSKINICIDTEGAQLRTSKIPGEIIDVKENEVLKISKTAYNHTVLILNPAMGADLLKLNDLISIDFNSVLGQVILKENDYALLKILNGGKVGQNKAITVDRAIDLPPLTAKDLKCIALSKSMGITHFALSFAGQPQDVEYFRSLISPEDILISKIESIKGLKNLEGIIKCSDAILIDRGDLSREVKIYKIPAAQKLIIQKSKLQNKKVYVATNLLESMILAPTPTRAEVNDVYNTLFDGADGLVLAAETAIGKYPLNAINMIKNIINEYESNKDLNHDQLESPDFKFSLMGTSLGPASQQIIKEELTNTVHLNVSEEILLDCNLISNGTFAPLNGFMNKDDIKSVLDDYRLSDGTAWSLPIICPVENDNFTKDQVVILCNNEGVEYFKIAVDTIFQMNLDEFALKLFNTNSNQHPGVEKLKKLSGFFISGKVTPYKNDYDSKNEWILSPKKLKEIFNFKGWKKIVGFHTRNIPHKGHEYIQKYALNHTQADGLLISPLIAKGKAGDFKSEIVFSCYQKLIESGAYPSGKIFLSGFASYPRFAGPREAIFTAICRKNMGCTHFIIGRDHSGVGSFYGPDELDNILEKIGNIGINIIKLPEAVLNTEEKTVTFNESNSKFTSISGSLVRKKIILDNDDLESILSAPVIQNVRDFKSRNVDLFHT